MVVVCADTMRWRLAYAASVPFTDAATDVPWYQSQDSAAENRERNPIPIATNQLLSWRGHGAAFRPSCRLRAFIEQSGGLKAAIRVRSRTNLK
jgi:hypothetical protein